MFGKIQMQYYRLIFVVLHPVSGVIKVDTLEANICQFYYHNLAVGLQPIKLIRILIQLTSTMTSK